MSKPLKYGVILTIIVAVFEIAVVFLYEFITGTFSISLTKMVILLLLALISSICIVLILVNIIPYLKKFILEKRSFIRFQSLSHPLLLKLSLEAPGTYHHSLMVANLSYQAAKAIGADAILTRLGAYYHDIGKLEDPNLFIENRETPSKINIYHMKELKTDAEKIINHVNYGLALAQKHNLPSEISVFIAEHHGTTTPLFFFNAAKEINPKIKEKDFRYPGPKPLSPESAVIMLADAIEATLRLVKDIDNNKIISVVNDIIDERMAQGELELSGLKNNDIKKIRESFIKTLSTIHHQRISY